MSRYTEISCFVAGLLRTINFLKFPGCLPKAYIEFKVSEIHLTQEHLSGLVFQDTVGRIFSTVIPLFYFVSS